MDHINIFAKQAQTNATVSFSSLETERKSSDLFDAYIIISIEINCWLFDVSDKLMNYHLFQMSTP